MEVDSYSDLSDIFHTELFYPSSIPSDPSPSSSPAQSPFTNALLTPPQSTLPTSFPDIHLDNSTNPIDSNPIDSSFFSLFDDELKATGGATSDPLLHQYDSSSSSTFFDMGFDHMHMSSMMGMGMPMDMSLTSPMPMDDNTGIDPQLVDSPSQSQSQTDFDADSTAVEEEEGEAEEKEKEEEEEKLVLTIPPVKVGGHGKARKGTVQSGGIVKKSAHAGIGAGVKDKENTGIQAKKTQVKGRGSKLPSAPPATASLSAPATVPAPTLLSLLKQPASLPSPPETRTSQASEHGGDDEDDELPHDWRPSPEVFAKMTSKEKRQLRNKISARNFRVRRKGEFFSFFFLSSFSSLSSILLRPLQTQH